MGGGGGEGAASCMRGMCMQAVAGGTAFMAMEDGAGEDAAGAGARRAVSGTL